MKHILREEKPKMIAKRNLENKFGSETKNCIDCKNKHVIPEVRKRCLPCRIKWLKNKRSK